jgi:arylsulfatase A-like enzyme
MPLLLKQLNRRGLKLAAYLGAAALSLSVGLVQSAQKQPNIVFMLVDNFGYGDLGSYGGGELRGVPTPRLDELAAQGMRLTNFNVEPECTPTRSALMTGRMPIRSGTSSVDVMGGKDGLTSWEYTLAELLSDAGYATAAFGKWHLGSSEERFPTHQGFDEWYGIPRSSIDTVWEQQPGYDAKTAPTQSILQARKGEAATVVKPYDYTARAMIDVEIADRAVAYIDQHAKQKPFFLYIPFTLPHTPPLAAPQFVQPGRSQYQNALAEIDANAGRVLDALNKAGIADDTIVVFASDNGPETIYGKGTDFGGQSDSGPFRGEFPSGWEGAIRVPGIIRWPGHTQPGRTSNQIVSILDFYRTFAHAADAADRVPTDRPIDSIDQYDFLFGKQEQSNRESVMFFHGQDLLSLKWRNFKVHFAMNNPVTSGPVMVPGQGVVHSERVKTGGYPWIFDLSNDPKELWNVAPSNGWIAPSISRAMGAYGKSVAQYPNIKPGAEGPEPK